MLNGPERQNVNHGGKSKALDLQRLTDAPTQLTDTNHFRPFLVILPPSALAKLTQLNIEYPMLFELANKENADRTTHGYVAVRGKNATKPNFKYCNQVEET